MEELLQQNCVYCGLVLSEDLSITVFSLTHFPETRDK
jgi:hypothetical protein